MLILSIQQSFLNLSLPPPAKFDPPVIEEIRAEDNGCLTLRWSLSAQQSWMRDSYMNLELRVKTADSSQWTSKPVSTAQHKKSTSENQFTNYDSVVRNTAL